MSILFCMRALSFCFLTCTYITCTAKTHYGPIGPIGPIRRVVTLFPLTFFKIFLCNNFYYKLLQIITPITDKKISSHFGPIGPIQTFLILSFLKKNWCTVVVTEERHPLCYGISRGKSWHAVTCRDMSWRLLN